MHGSQFPHKRNCHSNIRRDVENPQKLVYMQQQCDLHVPNKFHEDCVTQEAGDPFYSLQFFYPRDAAYRGLCAIVASVCPSHAGIVSNG